jgi:hypothetical protein
MTQQSESAAFCDAVAEPSPTDRRAAGRLSREITGEVIPPLTLLTGRQAASFLNTQVQGLPLAVATATQY